MQLHQIDQSEAELLKTLNHPFIVKYSASFLNGDYFYIVTEYCEVNWWNMFRIK